MHGPSAPLGLVALSLSLVTAGCRARGQTPEGPASASARPSETPAPSAARPPPRAAAPTPFGCRVLAVRGANPPPGTPPVGALFTGKTWVDLADGIELALKHGETTREFSVRGPGRFLACPDGEETVLVARGSVLTTPGPGSRGGAVVTLATPFGVVEYGDAALRLDVTDDGLVLDVKQGAASVVASVSEDRPGGMPPKPVKAPAGHLSLKGKVDATTLANRCADARAGLLPSTAPSAPAGRGKWAVGLLRARRQARLVCARARALAGRLDEPERARLESLLMRPKVPGTSIPDLGAEPGTDAGK